MGATQRTVTGPPDAPQFLSRPDGSAIAWRRLPGKAPGVMFLGGFRSDMTGTKATALEAHCRAVGRAFVRFDYFGHGASSGRFEEGTIGRWAEGAVAVLDEVARGPQVLVGSSMGGWIMLLAALARPERVRGLVGVAAAPDFTEDLIWAQLPEQARKELEAKGVCYLSSDYDVTPYPISRRLIEEGREHLLLRGPIGIHCPVRLIHGLKDEDVPWEVSLKLSAALASADVTLTLVKEGGHRLSGLPDIERLTATLEELCWQVEGGTG